eukprot:tig00021126_g18459.t1
MIKALARSRPSPEDRNAERALLTGPADIDVAFVDEGRSAAVPALARPRWSPFASCMPTSMPTVDDDDVTELVNPKADFACVSRVSGHGGGVRLAFHEASRTLWSAGEDSAVRVWTAENGLHPVQGGKVTAAHTSPITSICASASIRDPRAYTAAGDPQVKAWRRGEGGALEAAGAGTAAGYVKTVAEADGRVLCGLEDGRLQARSNPHPPSSHPRPMRPGRCWTGARGWRRAGRWRRGGRRRRAPSSPSPSSTPAPPPPPAALTPSPSGPPLHPPRLPALHFSLRGPRRDLRAGRVVRQFEGHTHWVSALVSDGRRLFSGSWDSDVRVWDLRGGECVAQLSEHRGTVSALALRPPFLFSGAADRRTKVWAVAGGRCVQTIADHGAGVTASAAGEGQLFTASCTGDIHLWQQAASPSSGGPAPALAAAAAGRAGSHLLPFEFPSLD